MQKLIARLIDCGLPRECAVTICRYYRKHGTLQDFAEYVAAVEVETRGALEAV